MRDFSQRWLVPGTEQLLAEWLDDLAVIGDRCACPDGYHQLWGALKPVGRHLGLYWDAEVLHAIVIPLIAKPSRILLAGSADQIGLRLLADIAGADGGHSFFLADRCAAPLALAQAEARRSGLQLTTFEQMLDQSFAVPEPVDLAFMHYTLNFMDSAGRRAALGQLKSVLAADGRLVIAHRAKADADRARHREDWVESILTRLSPLLAGHADAQEIVARFLPHHAGNKDARTLTPIAPDFAAAGLAICAEHPTTLNANIRKQGLKDRIDESSTIYVLKHA